MWKYNGSERPAFAIEPRSDQESVWDYPRPPTLVICTNTIEIGRDEQVKAQAGGFYGGWVTSKIVGPMKGDPGTGHW